MRSGSTLLADLLTNTKIAGNVDEYLRVSVEYNNKSKSYDYPKYIFNNLQANASENGVSGVKMMWNNFDYLLQKLNKDYCDLNLTDYDKLEKVFPNIKFIYIYRKNIFRQAISLDKAIQTGRWSVKNIKPNKINNYILSPKFVKTAIKKIKKQNQNWEKFFMNNKIKPYRVVYEDFPNNYENVIHDCINYLELDNKNYSIKPPTIQKQSGLLTNSWIIYYYLYTFLDYIFPKTFENFRKLIKKSLYVN